MASHTVTQVAPATARDGFDTRNQDLNGAHTEKWELEDCKVCKGAVREFLAGKKKTFSVCKNCFYGVDMSPPQMSWRGVPLVPETPAEKAAKETARLEYEKLQEAASRVRYELECAQGWAEDE